MCRHTDRLRTDTDIPAEDLPHVFERLYRVEGTTARAGSGLGLARQIIERHGAIFDVESEHGRTTTVAVHLPIAGRDDRSRA